MWSLGEVFEEISEVKKALRVVLADVASESPLPVAVTGDDSNPVNMATEDTLDDVKEAVDSIDGKVATETTADAIKTAVESLDNKDFATETTLDDVKSATGDAATALGAPDDAVVDAGDPGSVSAKLRRLTADVADVKTAVESLAGLITDGALPTKATLTGQLVKVVKEHIEVSYDVETWGNGNHQIGENIEYRGRLTRPVDMSEYPHVDILVRNDTDVPLRVYVRIYPVAIREIDAYGEGVFRKTVVDAGLVPAGDECWIRSVEEPQLNRVPACYVNLQTESGSSDTAPTEGTYTVVFLGSKV